jgi:two-component system response regulator LytT
MMNCIIIDDDNFIREVFKEQLSKIKNVHILADFSEPILGIKFLNSNPVDFIILDVNMPNFNGFDFINSLKNPVPVILITSEKEYAIKAFEYENVVDYLLKPIENDRLHKAIDKVEKILKVFLKNTSGKIVPVDEIDELYVGVGKRLVKLKFDEINYIEANGDYIMIHTQNERHIVHSTMKKIESKLSKSTFVKVHRSFIINLKKLENIEDNSIEINEKIIPISRGKKQELMNLLNLL